MGYHSTVGFQQRSFNTRSYGIRARRILHQRSPEEHLSPYQSARDPQNRTFTFGTSCPIITASPIVGRFPVRERFTIFTTTPMRISH